MHRRVGALMTVLLAACSAPQPAPTGAGPVAEPAADGHEHTLVVDWVPFSEGELHREAVAIARGRVLAQRSGFHRTYALDDPNDYAELPLTTSTLRVEATLRARAPAPPSEIDVVQLGGRYRDGCWVEPTDQRLLAVGDDVVLFLKPAGMVPIGTQRSTEPLAIVGGQQGLVPVRDGLVDPIPTTAFARYAGRPLDELEADIERLALTSWEEP